MAGAEAQAGFYYQNIVAAQYALELIEFGSQLRSITFENPRRARHIDDVIIDHSTGTTFVQVKWAQDETSSLTLHNLTAAEGESTSLLAKLARGYCDIVGEPGRKEIMLLSTRRPGTNRQPAHGFDKSLADFIAELHQPWVRAEGTSLQNLPAFAEYESILESLLNASTLENQDELADFLKCLRFQLGLPDRDTMADRVRSRLVQLGIEQRYYAELLDKVVRWSIETAEVDADDVRTALGVHDHFVDRVSHYFPVDRQVLVPTPGLFDQFDSSIQALKSGFILVEGEPGSGKSTALTMYLANRPEVRFGYYCFVPSDTSLANERLGSDAFVRSICIGLKNSFPDIEFPRLYAPHTVQLLNQWLHVLSAAGRRTVFVVDGLDHVDRRTRQSLVVQPLTAVLAADQIPRNVLIVLSSRYPGALPQPILDHVRADPRRHVQVPRFGSAQVREFLRLRGVALSDELLDTATTRSGGVPIYLEYLADRLGRLGSYEQERFLQDVPSLRDQRIDAYHTHLWQLCEHDETLVHILAVLAERNEFTAPETLRELLQLLGIQVTLNAVHEAVGQIRHVLKVSDSNSVAIRHASLREFIRERTSYLRTEVNSAIVDWYEEHPDDDDAWRNRLRHFFDVGDLSRVASTCDSDWLARAWANHRPIHEIQHNLDIAWRAAATERDLLEFVRIGLLKQQVALVARNLDLSEIDVAQLLLAMGRPEEALRRIWDGERRQCSAVAFTSFCLEHQATTGRPPAAHVIAAGLGDGPPPGADHDALRVWYRALCLTADDPVAAIGGIGEIRWRSMASHGHATIPMDAEEARLLNLELQLAAVREVYLHGRIDVLLQLESEASLPSEVRTAARAGLGLWLAKAGEDFAASQALTDLDVTILPETHERWIVLEAAATGRHGLPVGRTGPPSLPASMLAGNGLELESSLFGLYDGLRCYFLRDETGFPWLETRVAAWREPVRTLVLAVGRLARLWTDHILARASAPPRLPELTAIAAELDLPRERFQALDYRSDSAEYAFRQRAHEFYEHVWACAADVLSDEALGQLATWWAGTPGGERAARYPEATCNLAATLYGRLGANSSVQTRQLLEVAEQSGRSDEESSAIGSALLNCASAWARCGFSDEAQRVWCELFGLACGVYWRKDYQFNEVLTPLSLAHGQDPRGTLARIAEQLVLAHQLVGTARSNTVAVAVEGLIEFIAKVEPALGLRALVREESLVYRERALERVICALCDDDRVERRLLVALATTMGRWANYTEFDEHTNPTMFELYSSALAHGDLEAARAAYDIWRHVLLIEKEMPGELGRWAAAWSSAGEPPENVRQDCEDFPPRPHEDSTQTGPTVGLEDEREGIEQLDEAAGDIAKLEALLQERLDATTRRERARELDRFRSDWQEALGRAAKRNWSDADTPLLDECFAEFTNAALVVEGETRAAQRDALRTALGRSIECVAVKSPATASLDAFIDYFDFDGWADGFLQAGAAPYLRQRDLEGRLQQWIVSAPYTQLAEWEEFCRRHASGVTRATGLLKIAERCSNADRNRAVGLLIEAWQCVSDFFHEHTGLAKRLCGLLLELDSDKGTELVFESFRQQYSRFPETIVYRLDTLLDFVEHLPTFDRVRLYEIWSSHNRRLAAGLSEKPVDVSWLKDPIPASFQDACLEYLLELLDYPVVDVRLLAADELFRLMSEQRVLVGQVLEVWPRLGDGQKELVATVFFSLGIREPASASEWAAELINLGQQERHRNLRVTIAQTVEIAVQRRAGLDASVLDDGARLKAAPTIVSPLFHPGAGGHGILPPYLRWSLRVLADACPGGELEREVQKVLAALYSNPRRGLEGEAAVHRAYNINTNFDVIEINGPYDRAVRAALNRAVQSFVDSHDATIEEVVAAEDVLRVRDPSDALVQRAQRPNEVAWTDGEQSEEDFLAFADLETHVGGYLTRNGDWLTLFEYTEQRVGGRIGADSQRATVARVIAFGVQRGQSPPTEAEVRHAVRNGFLRRLRNRYRFELAGSGSPPGPGKFHPLVVVTGRAFRGRNTPDLAALDPQLAAALGLTVAPEDLLGLVKEEENEVVRSIEWQEAFDQGRRRHEPISAGYLLQVRKSELTDWADRKGVDLWAWATVRRTADRYKPENEKAWVEREELFQLT
jgi:hypothetical protein